MGNADRPEKLVQEALERAERLRRERRLTEARDVLIEALKHGVDAAQVYFRLGNVYYDQKDYDHAEYAYRRAIDHDPHHVNAHHNLAVVYRRQGRLAESVKMRRKANKLAFKHPDKVQLNPEQVTFLRRYARRLFLYGTGLLIAVLLGVLWWLS